MKDELLNKIKNNIREKQSILNEFMAQDNVDKRKAIKLSVELDELISEYYKLKYSE